MLRRSERKLRGLGKARRIEARVQQRARIVLLAAQGWQNKEIAVEVGLDRRQVALWRSRFQNGGIDALLRDAPRSGRRPTVTPEVESQILQVTLHRKPAAATHWSTRTLAEHLGLSATTVRRVWRAPSAGSKARAEFEARQILTNWAGSNGACAH